ncbi:hypothetical protein N9B94_00895 [Verrucomicrobia bacterium]|nr:hypothetical protein [Verrucomicrobiota bacterium]
MISAKRHAHCHAFARIDAISVFVLIVIIVAAISIILPLLLKVTSRAQRMQCVGNLKQISLASRIHSNEHHEQLPFQTRGFIHSRLGSRGNESNTDLFHNTTSLQTWHLFQVLSNELPSPRILICPKDNARTSNTTVHFQQDSIAGSSYSNPVSGQNDATSYFLGLNANEVRPMAILTGDRNITINNGPDSPMIPGFIQFGTSRDEMTQTWKVQGYIGSRTFHHRGGNLGLADGSVQQIASTQLPSVFQSVGLNYGTNALLFLFPNE